MHRQKQILHPQGGTPQRENPEEGFRDKYHSRVPVPGVWILPFNQYGADSCDPQQRTSGETI